MMALLQTPLQVRVPRASLSLLRPRTTRRHTIRLTFRGMGASSLEVTPGVHFFTPLPSLFLSLFLSPSVCVVHVFQQIHKCWIFLEINISQSIANQAVIAGRSVQCWPLCFLHPRSRTSLHNPQKAWERVCVFSRTGQSAFFRILHPRCLARKAGNEDMSSVAFGSHKMSLCLLFLVTSKNWRDFHDFLGRGS